jgi:hypothetical protein
MSCKKIVGFLPKNLQKTVQVQTPLALSKALEEIYANRLFMAWH